MSPKRRYDKFVPVPDEVAKNSKLQAAAKLFYGRILRLSFQWGYCSKTNKQLAELSSTSEDTIVKWLRKFKEERLMEIEHLRGGSRRKIYPVVWIVGQRQTKQKGDDIGDDF